MVLGTVAAARVGAAVVDAPGRDVVPADPPAASADSPEAALLARMAKVAEAIENVRAEFRQVRRTPLLRRPLESRGTIRLTRDLVIWETEQPSRLAMTVAEGEVRLYYPDERLLEIYPLENHLAAAAASPLLRPDRLRGTFEIEFVPPEPESEPREPEVRDRVRLKLTPRDERLRRRIESIVVEVEEETALVRWAEVRGVDGERTEFLFDAVETNVDEPIDDPTRPVPKGTTISRPGGTANERGSDATDDERP